MSMTGAANTSGGSGGAGMAGGAGSLYDWSGSLKRDKLNLSGLLNVLDGVVDTPERIVVMTTNHPEILDPALIRPGRIDQQLLLGYMNPANVVDMINHYFQLKEDGKEGLSENLVARIRKAILGNGTRGVPGLKLTPAQVEQLSAEHDSVEDMVAAIEAMVDPEVNSITSVSNASCAKHDLGATWPPKRGLSTTGSRSPLQREGSNRGGYLPGA